MCDCIRVPHCILLSYNLAFLYFSMFNYFLPPLSIFLLNFDLSASLSLYLSLYVCLFLSLIKYNYPAFTFVFLLFAASILSFLSFISLLSLTSCASLSLSRSLFVCLSASLPLSLSAWILTVCSTKWIIQG